MNPMPTYIALMNWTEQGIRDFKNTVSRTKPVSEAAERFGGKIRDTFWTVGPYDVVGIADFPDERPPPPSCCGWARWATRARRRCAPSTARR